MTKLIEIYTDGACQGNPGPGGWGAVIKVDDSTVTINGAENDTTNNRMELMAAIKSLENVKNNYGLDDILINLTTDSKYVKDGISIWVLNWKKNNWQTAAKKSVKNKDLWIQLDEITNLFKINWQWVKGHSGHPENEMADYLATIAISDLLTKEV